MILKSGSRRTVLGLLAGLPLLAATGSQARESTIARLIRESRTRGSLAERIDFISQALLGKRYRANTLIGGPKQKEVLVTRDDVFDCVTYCEAVLAAAISQDYSEYTGVLRRIRYANGKVDWASRNHDFAHWSAANVEKGICRPVTIGEPTVVEKNLDGGGLGKRQYRIAAVPVSAMLANPQALKAGDVVGFLSRRPDLDYFHTGFIAFSKRGGLALRHASQSRGRVVDDEMRAFVATTGAQYVTLLRAEERALA